MKRKAPALESVVRYIATHPDVTSVQIMRAFPVENRLYGRQRATSQVIAKARYYGLIEDCRERCSHCRRALTRGNRNVPLNVTAVGRRWLENGAPVPIKLIPVY